MIFTKKARIVKKKRLSNAIFYILLSNIVNIDNSNIGSCRRTTLPLPHGFSISRYFHALLPHTSTLEDNLVVFNEEENLCYMVQCLDYGDPLTARETGEETSNESAEMEDEDIQRDTRGSTTRSGRKSRRPRESSFLFYD